MRLRHDQLPGQLRDALAPVYALHGDEPLLLQEAADAVRAAARRQGYGEREMAVVETGFDWEGWLAAAASGSLFADRRLLELRLETGRPGDDGGKVLARYAARPVPDAVLLVLLGKLDAAAQKSAWFNALERAGVAVQARGVEPSRLPAWIRERMIQAGLQPTEEAAAWLAGQIEGNLLAAAQEIHKLQLLLGAGPVSLEQLRQMVGDSARYNVYDLVDAALAGQAGRVARIVEGLRGEGLEPAIASWAVQREVRLLAALAAAGGGPALDAAMNRHKVWERRRPLLRRAVGRLPAAVWRRLLADCARLDRLIKGAERGETLDRNAVWDQLLLLTLRLAGRDLLAGLNDN